MTKIIERLITSGAFTQDGYRYTLDMAYDGTWIVYRTPVRNGFYDMREAVPVATFEL